MAASWWVIEAPPERGTGQQLLEYIEADNEQDALNVYPGSTFVGGPYATQAAAEKAHPGTETTSPTDRGNAPASGVAPGSTNATPSQLPSFSLLFSGISGWFYRGLKVLFGGVLILIGVSHLTGLSNKLTQTANKLVPIAEVAAA